MNNFEDDFEEKHKEYILNLVNYDKIDPKVLYRSTKEILETYIQSISDSTLIPVLYNLKPSRFEFSSNFQDYLKKEKIPRGFFFNGKTERSALYKHIIGGFAGELSLDENNKKHFYDAYVNDLYGLQFVKDEKTIYKYYENPRDIHKEEFKSLYINNENIDIYEKLLNLKNNEVFEEEEIWSQFDMMNEIWFDPFKNKTDEINPEIIDDVIEKVALQFATGKDCIFKVEWVPMNRNFEIEDFNGYERVNIGSIFDELDEEMEIET